MCNAGKNTQEHPGDAVFQKYVSVIRRCGQDPHTRLCERDVLWAVKGRAGSHWKSVSFSLHPLVSLHELLAFVYVRGDKTQTRNGNGSERG